MAASLEKAASVNQWQFWLKQQNGTLLNTPEKAVDSAEAFVRARYGQAEVYEQRPFIALKVKDAWQVKGTRGGRRAIPVLRWVSVVTVSKKDGAVLEFWHQLSDADRLAFDSEFDSLGKPEADANP